MPFSQTRDRLEEFAIDVILERRSGKRAALLRKLLGIFSHFYKAAVRVRWWWYRRHLGQAHPLGCLVVSVGNLTVGGTGKTPVAEFLARELTRMGRRVAILSRGYKSQPRPLWQRLRERSQPRALRPPPRVVTDGRSLLLDSLLSGDEPYMLAQNLQDVAVLVDKDRVKSGMHAIQKFGADTLLLDDGFQYLRFQERLDIVLVDRETPFGNRRLLPRGTLREPPAHLRRADLVIITKCDGAPPAELIAEIRRHNRHAPIVESRHHPLYLENVNTQERLGLDALAGTRIGAICGIARPESFESGLRALGAEVVYFRHFADHHRFNQDEVLNALERTRARAARFLVVTEKDAVRLPRVERPLVPIYFLRMEIEILRGKESLDACLERACRGLATEASARDLDPELAPPGELHPAL